MKSFIYLIYSEIGLMIGKSSDINRRFAVIDEHSPIELQLLRVYRIVKNGFHEKRLHKQFKLKHLRKGWFALDLDDVEEIDSYLMDHGGTLILDNLKKVKQIHQIPDPGLPPHSARGLPQEINKLEDVVEKLKETLDGRKYL